MQSVKNRIFGFGFFLLLSTTAFGATSDKPETKAFTQSELSSLFKSCKTETALSWTKKYTTLEDKAFSLVKKLGDESVNAMDPDTQFIEMMETLYPEHLPKNYEMRGVFLVCMEYISRLQDAKTKAKALLEKDNWLDCLKHHEEDASEVQQNLQACFTNITQ